MLNQMKLFDSATLVKYLKRNVVFTDDMSMEDLDDALNGYLNAVEDKLMKTIPVMQTSIEGAQKRITDSIEWIEWFTKALHDEGYPPISSLAHRAADLDYIALFLDRLNDHIEATKNPNY